MKVKLKDLTAEQFKEWKKKDCTIEDLELDKEWNND